MQRILDIDLDFFVEGIAHHRPHDGDRLNGEEFPPWSTEEALAFLEGPCGLTDRLPGFVVERHAELFARWRDAIAAGTLTPPLAVTHVDAHADLGIGDLGAEYLVSEILFLPVEERCSPRTGPSGLNDGNWVLFAVACRWIGELTYVFNGSRDPGDTPYLVMENFEAHAEHLQLGAVRATDLAARATNTDKARFVRHYEPRVPFRKSPPRDFRATEPFDAVCLTRSPAYTPREADPLFDIIRARFIDEISSPTLDIGRDSSDRPPQGAEPGRGSGAPISS